MLEIKVTIDAPALAEAINNLAASLGNSVPTVASAPTVIPAVQQNAPESAQTPEMSAPVETPSAPQTTAPAPAQNATAPVPAAPAPAAPTIDLDAISRAGAALIDQGKMQQVMALLQKYGVQAITQLQASTYPAFAEDLRGLGAVI